jgi:hypothetical protein
MKQKNKTMVSVIVLLWFLAITLFGLYSVNISVSIGGFTGTFFSLVPLTYFVLEDN